MSVTWEDTPEGFGGLSSVVFALDVAHWAALGAHFVADDPCVPDRLATGRVDTVLGKAERFGILDEGDVTTLLVPSGDAPSDVTGAALLTALAAAGCVDLAHDVLQMNIGAPRPNVDQALDAAVVESLRDFRELVLISNAGLESLARVRRPSRERDAEVDGEQWLVEPTAHETPAPAVPAEPGARGRVVGDLFARVAGGDPELLAPLPTTERSYFVAVGAEVVGASLLAGYAVGAALHSWLRVPAGWSWIVAAWWAATMMGIARLTLPTGRQATRWATIAAAVPRLILSLLFGFMTAQLLLLQIFAAEVTARAGESPGLLDALTALHQLLADNSGPLSVFQWLPQLVIVLLVSLPSVLALLRALGPPTVYERIVELHNAHVAERMEAEEELHDAASRVLAARREVETILHSGSAARSDA